MCSFGVQILITACLGSLSTSGPSLLWHFYMDDGLKSFSSATEAIDVLKKPQDMLAQSNLRLHKIASNNTEVMRAFPGEDLAKGLQDLDIGQDSPPMQHSLGLGWDLSTDSSPFAWQPAQSPSHDAAYCRPSTPCSTSWDLLHLSAFKAVLS